jgi:AcrR family transcriptional regulator
MGVKTQVEAGVTAGLCASLLVTNISLMGKRERTRARLQECGLDLFEAQGFDQTTVAQIAAAAGVTEMTFFRHFPSKELAVLDDPYDPVIATAVAGQPRSLPPLARVVGGLRAAWAALPEPASDLVRRRVRIVAGSPALRAAAIRNNAGTENLVAAQLVADGTPPLPARVAAVAALAAMTAAVFVWSEQAEGGLGAAITSALDTLEGGSVDGRHG